MRDGTLISVEPMTWLQNGHSHPLKNQTGHNTEAGLPQLHDKHCSLSWAWLWHLCAITALNEGGQARFAVA